MENKDKIKTVAEAYNCIADRYYQNRDRFINVDELKEYARLLPPKARLLDAGCGAGRPVCKYLVERGHHVTGIDISPKMLAMARRNVPAAEFILMDMTELAFRDSSFDGISAFYSIIHIPREMHPGIFSDFHRLLKPDGIMLVSLGSTDWEGTENFHGKKMFWSHYAPERSYEIIAETGFNIIFDRFVHAADERHYWLLAAKT